MRARILVTIFCFSLFAILYTGLSISYFRQSKSIDDPYKKQDQIRHGKFCAGLAGFFLIVVIILTLVIIFG